MKKIDRRVLRTRQSLGDALVDLTLENGYDSIMIKDLTESAGIGYATFFRHFKSKDELLMYVLEVILDDMASMTNANMNPYEKSLITFQYIADNVRIYRVFVSLPPQSALTNAVYRVISASILQRYKPRNESKIPMDVAVNHIVTSMIELIRWWVTNDLSLSVEQMALIQSELIIKATEIVALEPIRDEMAMMD